MHRITALLLAFVVALCSSVPSARAYTLQYTDSSATAQLRWPTLTIPIAFSTSLNSPPSNIKPGSDVVGAAQRAFARWSDATGIQFNITLGDAAQASAQDGISLVTVSSANASLFSGSAQPQGRARTFFNPANGTITESDVVINPNSGIQFSTDGTNGTFDLESTFMHEIGHLLGLEHSGIVGATMQPRQSINGYYSLPAFTMRTLSDDDRAGGRAIYGTRSSPRVVTGTATLRGRVSLPGGTDGFGAHVWLEDVTTGRAVAGNIAISNGNYEINGIAPGRYRVIVEFLDEPVVASQIASQSGAYTGLQSAQIPFRTTEAGEVTLAANQDQSGFDITVGGQPFINATQLGVNNFISSVPVPLAPGTYTLFVAGDNLTAAQIPPTGVQINSPFFSVNQSSVFYQTVPFNGTQLPLIGFQATVSADAPSGEYSIRLQANSINGVPGEVAYITGGLAVENAAAMNPIDGAEFFVRQHYRDFFSREGDAAGVSFWTNQITSCGTDAECIDRARVNTSAAFYISIEFQQTGFLVYRIYQSAFGRQPRFAEFLPDTQAIGAGVVVGQPGWEAVLEANKVGFTEGFVQRASFTSEFPTTLSAGEYVDRLFQRAGLAPTASERQAAIDGFGGGGVQGRARALRVVAENQRLFDREYNPAFVLMQYFGYLRRNPNDAPDTDFSGYNFWVGQLGPTGGPYSNMVRAFIVSQEYRRRFGQP